MIQRGAGELGAAREARDDGDVLDLAALERLQEGVVVLERHTSVRIAARPQHVAIGEDAVAPAHDAAGAGAGAGGRTRREGAAGCSGGASWTSWPRGPGVGLEESLGSKRAAGASLEASVSAAIDGSSGSGRATGAAAIYGPATGSECRM